MILKVKKDGNKASFGLVCGSCHMLIVESYLLGGTGFALLTKVIPDMKHELDIPGEYTCPDCLAKANPEPEPEDNANALQEIADGIKR